MYFSYNDVTTPVGKVVIQTRWKNLKMLLMQLREPLRELLTGKCRLNFTKILDKIRIQNNGKKLRDFIPYWVKEIANLKITTFASYCYKYRVRVITNGKCRLNFANDLD